MLEKFSKAFDAKWFLEEGYTNLREANHLQLYFKLHEHSIGQRNLFAGDKGRTPH